MQREEARKRSCFFCQDSVRPWTACPSRWRHSAIAAWWSRRVPWQEIEGDRRHSVGMCWGRDFAAICSTVSWWGDCNEVTTSTRRPGTLATGRPCPWAASRTCCELQLVSKPSRPLKLAGVCALFPHLQAEGQSKRVSPQPDRAAGTGAWKVDYVFVDHPTFLERVDGLTGRVSMHGIVSDLLPKRFQALRTGVGQGPILLPGCT